MHRTLVALTLAGSLTLASTGLTAPRRAPEPSLLSHQEQLCEALGRFTLTKAQDRNAGLSLFTALTLSRQWDRRHGVSPPVRAIHDDIIRGVYAAWSVTPALLQQVTESACLEEVQQVATTSTTAKDRY